MTANVLDIVFDLGFDLEPDDVIVDSLCNIDHCWSRVADNQLRDAM